MNCCDALRRKFQQTKIEEDHNSYKKQRNKTNILVRKSKKEFNKKLLTDSANNSQKFWQAIKEIFPSKESETCSKSYVIDGIPHSKPSLIPSKFSYFFSCIDVRSKSTTIFLKNLVWSQLYQNLKIIHTTFKFTAVTENETFKHLKNLKRKKPSGIDNLPPEFLKDTAFNIAKSLKHLINLCYPQ